MFSGPRQSRPPLDMPPSLVRQNNITFWIESFEVMLRQTARHGMLKCICNDCLCVCCTNFDGDWLFGVARSGPGALGPTQSKLKHFKQAWHTKIGGKYAYCTNCTCIISVNRDSKTPLSDWHVGIWDTCWSFWHRSSCYSEVYELWIKPLTPPRRRRLGASRIVGSRIMVIVII